MQKYIVLTFFAFLFLGCQQNKNSQDEDNFKIVHIDAEELAEFNFDFFMPQINEILLKQDIELEVKKADDIEYTYEVFINGEKMKLYTEQELNDYSFWNTAPRNFFRKVNDILKNKGSEEMFYLLYGGNDLHVILLTDNQYKIISEKYVNNKKEIPYLP